MLVLFETAAGFALFKVLDESKLKSSPKDIDQYFSTPQKASSIVSLKKFYKFDGTLDALEAATALAESKVPESLQEFLQKNIIDEKLSDKLIVSDLKFGNAIKDLLNIKVLCDETTNELIRGIRLQLNSLVSAKESDLNSMSIGLSHSYSRYKLKFSPDKVDTMIVQAISLLQDLSTEINIYAMRAREWYGWHFPELSKIIATQPEYAKAIKAMGNRKNAVNTDFTGILPDQIADEVKEAAQISMGTEIAEEDLEHIYSLCDQYLSIQEYYEELSEYLRNRMNAIAPNLTILVGEIVGAKLICRAGSLMTLAKYPSSTIQILGAEKAFFRAVKTKHNTPKYGLIYNAKMVNDISLKNKGKMSRVLAAKAALSARFDALCETSDTSYGINYKSQLDRRSIQIENGEVIKKTKSSNGNGYNKRDNQQIKSYDHTKSSTNQLQSRTPAKKDSKESSITAESNGHTMEVDTKKEKSSKKEKVESESESESESEKETKKKSSKKEEKEDKKKSSKKDDKEDKKKSSKKEEKMDVDSEDEKPKKSDKKSSKKEDKEEEKKSEKKSSKKDEEKEEKKSSKKSDKKEEKKSSKKKVDSDSDEEEEKPKKSDKKSSKKEDKEEKKSEKKSSKKDKEDEKEKKSKKDDKKRSRDDEDDEKVTKKKK
ncbi:4-aminobutyrate transaminase [Tieghemostelium lacteum]|uniref:4-aminobutyrate transaminase n=1 Tax=Tieghemostelium lacteum TaxID=361077 RepID=A0A151Z663_TIELA|nr:4-aminobutyrate transaminase [Tieghemostelium lacteum]|eukprot:KYQ89294.1 4-aminobutyrate transaminase [Tieghemostelium lacteum]